jgi:hypothetical protein
MKYNMLVKSTGEVLEREFTVWHLEEATHHPIGIPFHKKDVPSPSVTELQALRLVNDWNRRNQAQEYLYWI